jgi:hypothetical protein
VSDICRWLEIDHVIPATFQYGRENATAHPKSLLVTQWAKRARDATNGALERVPMIKGALRRTYLKLNTSSHPAETLTEGTRRQLEARFQRSNATVAELLMGQGYIDLPEWLLPPFTSSQS